MTKTHRVYLPTRVRATDAMLAPRTATMASGDWAGAVPYAVYLIECWTEGALYVGISRADILYDRLRDHWDDSFLDGTRVVGEGTDGHGKLAPNSVFLMAHGYRATAAVLMVPGKKAAEAWECDWTYSLAANARVVFGRGITATCPGTKWLNGFGGIPWWNRNTVRSPQ